MKTLLNYQLQNEVSKANFNTVKRIYNRPPFMKVVYSSAFFLPNHTPVADPDLELREGGGVFSCPAGLNAFSHFFFFCPK